jgi:penicillin G amidase
LLTAGFFFAILSSAWGPLPALGPFFSVSEGFWQNLPSKSQSPPRAEVPPDTLVLAGQEGDIRIFRDKRGVPHVFAQSDRDLFFGQGYATARDRLWQMDFQARAAGGRLAEVLGEKLLAHDLIKRKIGMVFAAERLCEAAHADINTRTQLNAFSDGVNTWIEQLPIVQWPVEYKLMSAKPEPWTPLKSCLFAKEMARELSTFNEDFAQTNAHLKLGAAVVRRLFPYLEGASSPIISQIFPQPVSISKIPKQDVFLPTAPFDIGEVRKWGAGSPENGSNNWAVAARKSTTQFPMLSNDPHLGLRLPSIWYEMQLHAPGINVYGATLPGVPSVIVGFNDDLAWGVTNGGTDVLDWYRITFKESDSTQYLYDGKIMPVHFREERISVKGKPDTLLQVPYTHHGPVVGQVPFVASEGTAREKPWPVAMRWAAHEPSNEFLAFFRMNKATNLSEFEEGLARYTSPIQNFALITKTGDVAIYHAGNIPRKWEGQGTTVLDGSRKDHDWQGFLPIEARPKEVNPEKGFVSSANQHPTNASYPYFVSGVWNATSSARGAHIAALLAQEKKLSPEDFFSFQRDVFDNNARELAPLLSKLIEGTPRTDAQKEFLNDFALWDFHHNASSKVAYFFDLWRKNLRRRLWAYAAKDTNFLAPGLDVTTRELELDPQQEGFDDPKTVAKEDARFHAWKSFLTTWDEMVTLAGPWSPTKSGWELREARGTILPHMARLKGFGFDHLPTEGVSTALNAQQKNHGPSYRIVVTFDEAGPRAWSHLPGGPSGDPSSPWYSSQLDSWLGKEEKSLQNITFLQEPPYPPDTLETSPLKENFQPFASRKWWLLPCLLAVSGILVPNRFQVRRALLMCFLLTFSFLLLFLCVAFNGLDKSLLVKLASLFFLPHFSLIYLLFALIFTLPAAALAFALSQSKKLFSLPDPSTERIML